MVLSDGGGERLIGGRTIAVALSALLHASVVSAALVELPRLPAAAAQYAIDVTIERALRENDAAAPVEQVAPPALDQIAALRLDEPARRDRPSATAEAERGHSDAVATTPTPPRLEQAMPSIDSPPSIDAHDFIAARPIEELLPPVEAPPGIAAREFAPAAAASVGKPSQRQPVQATAAPAPPAKRVGQDARPRDAPATVAHAPPVLPKDDRTQRKAEEDYFWQIVRRISQYRFAASAQQTSERGMVVTRMTIARDGRLLDLALVKSSGSATLDGAVLGTIRQASPFAPLPVELAQAQQTFVVPVSYTRER